MKVTITPPEPAVRLSLEQSGDKVALLAHWTIASGRSVSQTLMVIHPDPNNEHSLMIGAIPLAMEYDPPFHVDETDRVTLRRRGQ